MRNRLINVMFRGFALFFLITPFQTTQLFENRPLALQGLFNIETMNYWALCRDDEGATGLYGFNLINRKVAKSTDDGANWTDIFEEPATSIDIADWAITGGKIYSLHADGSLFVSSGLKKGSTWTNITCPIKATNATGRPYGLAAFNGYIFQGEYSTNILGDLKGGPKILRYNIAKGTWAQSGQFANARHIHSFYTPDSSELYVSLGDACYGSDIGIWRLTKSGMGGGKDGADSWNEWTAATPPHTINYPVDFIMCRGVSGVSDGLYCSSDRPGKHILYSKISGSPPFNLNAQIFAPADSSEGETVRSVIREASTNNLYWFTEETEKPAIYISPPPYVQSVKLFEYPSPLPMVSRSIQSGDYIMVFNQRLHIEKFTRQ